MVKWVSAFGLSNNKMAMVGVDDSSLPTSGLTAQVDWLGLRVGGHLPLHLHSSYELGKIRCRAWCLICLFSSCLILNTFYTTREWSDVASHISALSRVRFRHVTQHQTTVLLLISSDGLVMFVLNISSYEYIYRIVTFTAYDARLVLNVQSSVRCFGTILSS